MTPSQRFRAKLAKAKKGNTEAQAFVKDCHFFGLEGVTKDLTLAFKFCRMAAEGGDTDCQCNLAVCYDTGAGVERDETKATAWFLKAAKEGGNAAAQFYTAKRYKLGFGHDAPNMKEAVKWLQAAIAQGHAAAAFYLADCYADGDGVKKNPGLALKLWRKCAQHDDATAACDIPWVAAAHHNIGNCYWDGSNGVEVDMAMAMQWWTKAAEMGSKPAQHTIRQIYLMGFLGELAPFGTFDRDVPHGMKNLKALIDQKCEAEAGDAADISKAEALIRDFHAAKSCMGCGSAKARKLCSGCLYHADHTKVRYCGEACQRIHWRHQTASHKAKCGSRAAARASTGAA
jgi:TPR repeat protein